MGHRILVVNHYADDPEGQATRTFDLSRALVQRGHAVTVIAAGRSHYTFEERKTYAAGRTSVSETLSGVRFLWVKTPPYKRNGLRRFWNITVFAWRALLVGLRDGQRPSVVIGVTVHPLAALAAWCIAAASRARFYYEITDIWPDTLIEMGAIPTRHPVTWALRRIDAFLLRRARRVIMLWPFGDRYLQKHGLPGARAIWIPHCVDLARYEASGVWDGGDRNDFTILYLGGHTREYGLDTILDAARLLQERGEVGARFRFVGGGTEKARLRDRAASLGLRNVVFDAPVAKSAVGRVIAESDAVVFSRLTLPLFREYGISNNKLCDYLASNRPIIYACDAANDPVRDAGAGISVESQNPEALAHAVERLLAATPAERIRMGRAGREYAERVHAVGVVADLLESVLAK